jgi:Amt family ammonium transporter
LTTIFVVFLIVKISHPQEYIVKRILIPCSALLLPAISNTAFAAESTVTLNLNTVWVVTASVLVFFMQAGFALLESGSTRAKNSINVMMKNFIDVCLATLVFWTVGYGLMFGSNSTGWFGESQFMLNEASQSDYTMLLFQSMFAATAATIVSGAIAERTKFAGYIFCAIILTAFIYPIYGSWVWNAGGWLSQRGFVDFAGSTVVHSIGGWCALAAAIVIGPRLGRFDRDTGEPRDIPGHNLSLVALGGFILWMGWFGFNAGSTLEASESIGLIALNTQLAACAGALGTVVYCILGRKPMLLTSCVNGALSGLVGITAGCASMDPQFAILTGFVAGLMYLPAAQILLKFKIDDVVGAIPVHGIGGAWGTIAAGVFYQGDMFNMDRITTQLIGVGAGFFWAFFVALILFQIIHLAIGLRVDSTHEQRGLDFTEHHEVGYPEFHQLTQSFK